MNPLPDIPDAFQSEFDKMWHSACRVCDNIRAFQPDLLLVLMHSGWGPVFAAQVLWSQTESLPFPPIARTNLGREKINIFDKTFNMLSTSFFIGQYSSAIETGKLLAWVDGCKDWHAQLRQQVAEALQTAEDPRRILVVDDCIYEGSTAILALGLLNSVYPHADVRFLDANSWYRSTYQDFMLAAICPVSSLFPNGKIPSQEVNTQLGSVAVGSENVSEDSLFWQPILIDSPSVQALSVYRPAADWVQASQTIYAIIARVIRERSASYIPNKPNPRDFNFGLQKDCLMMRDIWLEDGITRRQAEQRYGLSSREVDQILERWIEFNDIEPKGYGRWTRYDIPIPRQRYINKVDIPQEYPDEAYWLLPGRLMFGECPGYAEGASNAEWAHKEVRELLDRGVDSWLDVQIVQEGASPKENPLFLIEAQAIGRPVKAQTIPLAIQYISQKNYILTRRGRPNSRDIRKILDQIDQYLEDGYILYVSADDDALRGILAGCYLARHGQSGAAALSALQARRATSANGWKREPASRKARRYVRSWPAGL